MDKKSSTSSWLEFARCASRMRSSSLSHMSFRICAIDQHQMSSCTSSGADAYVSRGRSSKAYPATSPGPPMLRCISFQTMVMKARVVCMPFTMMTFLLYRYAPMAAVCGTVTASPTRGICALGFSGGFSSTMLPVWFSASTEMTGSGSPVTSRPAQMRSTMQGTTSTRPASWFASSFTALESFSQAYSTGRSSSSRSGRLLSRGPSQFDTLPPTEVLNDLAP
mmetsp:Transcript_37385/g.105501  ORF Transcript_37385/g.105501 Transcript_37385/m.105501 type:complete len:222 (-) Transcript_37385:734-1399(-)